jgi:hypothetical protein
MLNPLIRRTASLQHRSEFRLAGSASSPIRLRETLRDNRIGHHIAGSSGQSGEVYFGVVSTAENAISLTDVQVTVDSEYADQALMENLEKLSTALRGRLGSHLDLRRPALRDLARSHAKDILDAVGGDHPWQEP